MFIKLSVAAIFSNTELLNDAITPEVAKMRNGCMK